VYQNETFVFHVTIWYSFLPFLQEGSWEKCQSGSFWSAVALCAFLPLTWLILAL